MICVNQANGDLNNNQSLKTMLICVLQSDCRDLQVFDACERTGLSPAPFWKVCGISHFTPFPKGENAHENTRYNWAPCWGLQASAFATNEQKPFHWWFQEVPYSMDCQLHFSPLPEGSQWNPVGSMFLKDNSWRHCIKCWFTPFQSSEPCSLKNCSAPLNVRCREHRDGRPKVSQCVTLTHYLHLHLQNSICKGNLLNRPDLSSTNVFKKLLGRALLNQKSRTTELD